MAKEVLMMVMAGCPHCRNAFEMMDTLRQEHPEYAAVKVKIVDETIEKDFAASLDYYYVPTFYVDGQKVHEGGIYYEEVEQILLSCSE